jgi:hypothetical protein
MAKKVPRKPRQHNYLRKLAYLQRVGALPLSVGVHQIDVYHDKWCGIYRNDRCHCDPDIKLAWSQPAAGKN